MEKMVPIPYDEDKDPDKFWDKDPFDSILPKTKGFINDFVYFLRGYEVPTLFTVWAAIFGMSSAIKREAWVDWGYGKLYANMYIIIVTMAGGKKSEALSWMDKVLRRTQFYVDDQNIKLLKKLKIVRDSATPEALLEAMRPDDTGGSLIRFKTATGEALRDANGNEIPPKEKTSEVAIILKELSSMLGKEKYNETMIAKLIAIYDPDDYEWRTMSRGGLVLLKNCYTTLIGATVPDSFRKIMPHSALGDGFLSRTILAYQEDNPRCFPEPIKVKNGPTLEELQKRLGFIANNTLGRQTLSEEARSYYHGWYAKFKSRLKTIDNARKSVYSRMDKYLLKIAMLIKAHRYAPADEQIGLEDLKTAKKILERTINTSPALLAQLSPNQYESDLYKIESYIKQHKAVSRKQILQNTRFKAKELTEILEGLFQTGTIVIFKDNKPVGKVAADSEQVYKWNGG